MSFAGRRKQKWAVDPRNTAWSNDDSKFGQRMLEKMGWSKGKVFREEQKMSEPRKDSTNQETASLLGNWEKLFCRLISDFEEIPNL